MSELGADTTFSLRCLAEQGAPCLLVWLSHT
jgi:hypothetical protein